MIVQCDQCGQRARIREDKLPPQGGKIRCPQCQNVIIVRPTGASASPAKPPSPAAASRPARKPPATKPPRAEGSTETATKPPAATAKPPAAGAKPSPAATDEGTSGTAAPSTWKLRVSGLTYSFQTLDSLHQWLQGREKLDGILVARDSDDWKAIGEYPEVLTDGMRLRFFPAGDVPTGDAEAVRTTKGDDDAGSSDDVNTSGSNRTTARASTPDMRNRQRRARQSAANMRGVGGGSAGARSGSVRSRARAPEPPRQSSRAGTLAVVLLLVVGAGVGAHFGGLIDLGNVIPGLGSEQQAEELLSLGAPAEAGTVDTTNNPNTRPSDPLPDLSTIGETSKPTDDAEDARLDEELARAEREKRDRSLTRARELIKERRYAEARAIVEPVAKLWPEHLEVQETLLSIYERLDLRGEARDQKALVATLREKARAATTDDTDGETSPEDG